MRGSEKSRAVRYEMHMLDIAYLTARWVKAKNFFYRYIIPDGILLPAFEIWLPMQFVIRQLFSSQVKDNPGHPENLIKIPVIFLQTLRGGFLLCLRLFRCRRWARFVLCQRR